MTTPPSPRPTRLLTAAVLLLHASSTVYLLVSLGVLVWRVVGVVIGKGE